MQAKAGRTSPRVACGDGGDVELVEKKTFEQILIVLRRPVFSDIDRDDGGRIGLSGGRRGRGAAREDEAKVMAAIMMVGVSLTIVKCYCGVGWGVEAG